MLKTCARCKEQKPLDEFFADKSRHDKKRRMCKVCDIKRRDEWREASKKPDYRPQEHQKKKPMEEKIKQRRKTGLAHRIANRSYHIIANAKTRSKKKGIPFDLDQYKDEIRARLEEGVCEVSGVKLEFHSGARKWNTPSIDKIRPQDGYIYSNIRIVAYAVNLGFGSWGMEKYLELARAVDARYKLQQQWENQT